MLIPRQKNIYFPQGGIYQTPGDTAEPTTTTPRKLDVGKTPGLLDYQEALISGWPGVIDTHLIKYLWLCLAETKSSQEYSYTLEDYMEEIKQYHKLTDIFW